jgi:recombination protein RecT
MGNIVQAGEKFLSLKSALEKNLPAIKAIAAAQLDPVRLLKIVLSSASRNPTLLSCTTPSIIKAVMQSSECGLECGGFLGEAYLVPFRNRKTQALEAQFLPGYKGLCKLARNSGEIVSIYAEAVYPGDEFVCELGLNPKLIHVPDWDSESRESETNLEKVYAVARSKHGKEFDLFVVLSKLQIERIRRSSKSQDEGPWFTHFEEMSKKSAIRRLCKNLDLDSKMTKALFAQAQAELGDFSLSYELGGEDLGDQPSQQSGMDKLKSRLKRGRPPASETGSSTEPDEIQPGGSNEQEQPSREESLRKSLEERINSLSPSLRAKYQIDLKKCLNLNELLDLEIAIQGILDLKKMNGSQTQKDEVPF